MERQRRDNGIDPVPIGPSAQLQADQDDGIYVDPELVLDARAPNISVDVDFQQALRNAVENL